MNYEQQAVPEGTSIRLVVGLGNPGRRYERTRHNVGFLVVDRLAELFAAPAWREEHRALATRIVVDNQPLLLAKPQTFMNNSGQAVRALLRWHSIAPDALLVVSDDLDLPFGRMRLRPGGSPGGHKGLRSVAAEIGAQDFARLRIGIGRPTEGDPLEWVLTMFGPQELQDLAYIVGVAGDAVLKVVRDGLLASMNAFNGRADVRSPAPTVAVATRMPKGVERGKEVTGG